VAAQLGTLYKGVLCEATIDLHGALQDVGAAARVVAELTRACQAHVAARFKEAQANVLAALHVKADASQLLDASFKRTFQARLHAHAHTRAQATPRGML
jgi:hypothetical protein